MLDNLPNFNIIDIVAIVLIVLWGARGYRRGLSGELASVVSVITALVLGLFLYQPVGDWTAANTRLTGDLAQALAFGITVVLVILTAILFRTLARKVVSIVFAESIDKSLGLLAGFVRGCVIVTILFLIMNLWPHEYLNRKFGEESVIGKLVLKAVPSVRKTIKNIKIKRPSRQELNEN